MNRDRFAEIERVCQAALDQPPDERAAFLDEACKGDHDLRSEIEALLAVRSRADRLMEAPVAVQGALAGAQTSAALAPGTLLGPYEVEAFADQGGMGQVYRARDTRLGRTVAIKVLPPAFGADPDRRARFRREAKTIAGLSHPNICALYDVGEHAVAGSAEPELYLVMEHLTGETLAERLRKGPLPVEQALTVATQIADALAAAHREGVIHRDVKPANVMLTKSGAKLLDFGLAKLHSVSALGASVGTSSPGTPATATVPGAILGTVPYMAPEQLEGKEADARSDIFSFGAVLYEMLTGQRAFEGDSQVGVMAAILEREPSSLSVVRSVGGADLERLVRKCLKKDPDARWQSAGDLADELRWVAGGPEKRNEATAVSHGRTARRLVLATLVVIACVGGFLAYPLVRSGATSGRLPVRLLLPVAPAEDVDAGGYAWYFTSPAASWRVIYTPAGSRGAFAWSPDGRTLVFVGRRNGRTVQSLYRRDLDRGDVAPIPGTEGAQQPAYSNDGKWIAFTVFDIIKKIPADRGPAVELCRAPAAIPPMGITWVGNKQIVFASGGELWRVPAAGGTPQAITRPAPRLRQALPQVLPGERVVLYTERGDERVDRIMVQPLAGGEPTKLIDNAADARYLSSGHLVFLRLGTLFAIRFDARTLETTGDPVAIEDGIAQALTASTTNDITGLGHFAISANGTMAFIASPVLPHPNTRLLSVDRTGRSTPVTLPPAAYDSVAVSPDGRFAVLAMTTMTGRGFGLLDLSRGNVSPIEHMEHAWNVQWMSDSRRVLISYEDKLVIRQLDGSVADREMPRPVAFTIASISSNDDIAGTIGTGDARRMAIVATAAGRRRRTRSQPSSDPGSIEVGPLFSPDERALAYTWSNVTTGQRRSEVYVMPYPGPGAPVQVSLEGGRSPAWNPRGGELFYVAPTDAPNAFRMMAVPVQTSPNIRVGSSQTLFTFDYRDLRFDCIGRGCYDVAPDGKSFLVVDRSGERQFPPVTHINIVLNWVEEMKMKMAEVR